MTPPPSRLPRVVYLLALGVFCLGTSEFMLAGLLPQISADLGVSVPDAGLLITAFAVGMLLGAPLMTIATLRLPRRAALLGAGAVFALMHLLPLVIDGYAGLLIARVVAAVACATYWAVGAVLAVRLSPAHLTARAMAAMVGGLTLANILGVPGGTWVGERFGWRTTFAVVAVITVGVLVLLWTTVPATPAERDTPLRALIGRELSAFGDRRLWLALGTTALFQAAVFCTFSYLAALLIDVSGISSGRVALVLLIFGIGSLVGVTIGGRYADRDMLLNVLLGLAAMILSLAVLRLAMGSAVGVTIAIFLFGAAAFSLAAALNGRVFAFAGDAATLTAAVNVSAFNVGNAVGPWIGGLTIGAGLVSAHRSGPRSGSPCSPSRSPSPVGVSSVAPPRGSRISCRIETRSRCSVRGGVQGSGSAALTPSEST